MFKNQGSFAHIPYWSGWRTFCGLYLLALILLAVYVTGCWLIEVPANLPMPKANWQIGLVSLMPVMFLVACFSMCPYGDD